MVSAQKLEQLGADRSLGIGRLFLNARRDFTARLYQKLEGQFRGTKNVLPGGVLVPFLDLEGVRSSELARRAGISKQAVAKLLRELEEAEFVTRREDPEDRRAQIICFTDRGVEYLLSIQAAVKAVEQEYAELLGEHQLQELRMLLLQLVYPEKRTSK